MASNAVLREQTLSERILSLNEHMEDLAAAGDWSQVEEVMGRRNAMLSQLDDSERGAALLAARCATMQIQQMAEVARHDVADKLTALKRGKQATNSYQSHA